MAVHLRIKSEYFKQILEGKKNFEYRKDSQYFNTVFSKEIKKIVLQCGLNYMVCEVLSVRRVKTPKKYRNLSFLDTDHCFAIKLGKRTLKKYKRKGDKT